MGGGASQETVPVVVTPAKPAAPAAGGTPGRATPSMSGSGAVAAQRALNAEEERASPARGVKPDLVPVWEYRLGEEIRLDVAARYLFGGVPANHRVEIDCELVPSSFSPATKPPPNSRPTSFSSVATGCRRSSARARSTSWTSCPACLRASSARAINSSSSAT